MSSGCPAWDQGRFAPAKQRFSLCRSVGWKRGTGEKSADEACLNGVRSIQVPVSQSLRNALGLCRQRAFLMLAGRCFCTFFPKSAKHRHVKINSFRAEPVLCQLPSWHAMAPAPAKPAEFSDTCPVAPSGRRLHLLATGRRSHGHDAQDHHETRRKVCSL